jgi:hypothetical protein
MEPAKEPVHHMEEQLDAEHLHVPLRRSTRNRNPVQRLDPRLTGQRHAEVTLPMVRLNPDTEPDWALVTFICITQLSMKAGLKRFSKKGEAALSKKLNQLHLLETFEPVDSMQLSSKERKKVMESQQAYQTRQHLILFHQRLNHQEGTVS